MTEIQPTKGRARIYACGGAAINIVGLIPTLAVNPDLMADFDVVQIDTSRSNLTARANNFESYLLTTAGVDGGGKDRTENRDLIAEHTKPILKEHPPRDVNIVISSGSGSSGSTQATFLVSELLSRGESVIVLLIGTTGSRKEALNTVETLKNYEQIARKRNAPVVMHYMQNSPTMPREKVNQQMLSTISYIGMLFSRRNAGMDTKDTSNFLYFTKPEVSKGLHAQLYSLSILLRETTPEGEEAFMADVETLGNVLAAAVLAKAGNPTELPASLLPEYHTEGFVPDLKDSRVFEKNSVNYLITDGLVEQFVTSLRAVAKADVKQVATSSLLGDDEEDGGVNF